MPTRYSAVMPSRIKPVDSVTMSGLRSTRATSRPLTRPMTTAHTNTMKAAYSEAVVRSPWKRRRGRWRAARSPPPSTGRCRPIMIDEHLPEGDEGDDAAEREQAAPRRRGEGRRGDDLADDAGGSPVGQPDRDEPGAEQQAARQRPEVQPLSGPRDSADSRLADLLGQRAPPVPDANAPTGAGRSESYRILSRPSRRARRRLTPGAGG